MENFLKLTAGNSINFSLEKLSETVDQSEKSNVIKLIQKIIFKHDVLVDFKAILSWACSLEHFTVTNESVKKIIKNLHGILFSDVDDEIKINVFCCTFQSLAESCRDEGVAALQFLVVLCHILGIKVERINDSDDVSVVVNETNFQNVFGVSTSKPIPVCFQILNGLLISLLKLPVNLNSTEMQGYYKWLQQLIRTLSSLQPFQPIFMDIFLSCSNIEIKLLESNFDYIFPTILAQNLRKKHFHVSYEAFLINSLKICGKFQRTLKFISKFLSNIKYAQTELTQEIILPPEFCVEFSKIVLTASSQQSLLLMEVLVQYVDECFQMMLESKSGVKALHLGVISEILITFLKEMKIFASSISSSTIQSFIDKLYVLENVLQKFGLFLFSDNKFILEYEPITQSFLRLCYYSGEIQTLVDCYKDFSLSETVDSTVVQDWHCCLSLKQWNALVKMVLKSKLNTCNPICFQLALQRLRTQKLKNDLSNEDSTLKLILAQFRDDNTSDIFQQISPEDMTTLMEVLSIKQSKSVVKRVFKQILQAEEKQKVTSWLMDWRLQENSTFNIILFSELVKETGNVLSNTIGEKAFSKIDWLIDEYFDDSNNVDVNSLEKLPERLSDLLLGGRKLRKTIKNLDISRLVKLFKCLPLAYMNEDLRRLGLSFAVALSVISSDDSETTLLLESVLGFLSSDVDASTCFHIGYCIKWLSEVDNPTDNLRLRIIEGLVRSCPNSKLGLGQISEVVDAPESFKRVAPLRVLETQVTVYQELGKCWLRAKKRKSDNDIIGGCRTKLAKVITEEVKEMDEKGIHAENYKVLFKIAGIELNKAVKGNKENEISNFMQLKFPSYYEYALNNLKSGYDEASVLFLTIVLQSVPTIRSFIPENCFKEIWSAVKNYERVNWRLFASSSLDAEFDVTLTDLLNMTKMFLSSPSESCNYFEIWAPFIEGSSDLKKNACQLKLQELFNFIQDCQLLLVDVPVRKKIFIAKFFSFCLSQRKVILTSHMTDTIIHVLVEFCDENSLSMEDFQSLFTAQIDAGSSILSRRFTWNKNKVHLTYNFFKHMLGWLMRRCGETQLSNDDVIVLSACAFSLEKWVSSMAKEQKDFARISAYFITTIVSTIASVTVPLAIKIHLTNCLNHFLSISDSHTITYLLRILKPGYQQVFNSIYDQFKKYYKYSGKV